jgi:indolepyruvate ferredoxin oxidoreductase alpha subunit
VSERQILLGNEAIAHGLMESACTMATSYPGTPASEVLGTLIGWHRREPLQMHLEWSINEKVAFEVALANSYCGRRSAVIMKQVGLNVASDPLMSAAYTGVVGGLVVIVADDPGPHSSQTEQDSRFYAMLAKVPVLDPASPVEARDMVGLAFELSERHRIPVILRPTTRVCHARQDALLRPWSRNWPMPLFEKEPSRWAATPKFRLLLHQQLNEKIAAIAQEPQVSPDSWPGAAAGPQGSRPAPEPPEKGAHSRQAERFSGEMAETCIVASGVAFAHTREILADLDLDSKVPLFQVPMPYPLPSQFRDRIVARFRKVLVIEESYPVIELQFQNRERVSGRTTGAVPLAGELLPEVIEEIIRRFLALPAPGTIGAPPGAARRPTLCAGCAHRAAFFAIRKAFPKGIYPSDIGCYTLGLNLAAVDTVLCMGASISQAAGFTHAYRTSPADPRPVVATIGDSTFFHSGIPALVNAVIQDARFVLVILDNGTTAMTGHQPTPAGGVGLDGRPVPIVAIADLVRACGVKHLVEGDPYDLKGFVGLLKEAGAHTREPDGRVAVVIARRPCLMDRRAERSWTPRRVKVTDRCEGCHFCLKQFECPALVSQGGEQPIRIDGMLCSGCGVCVQVCPHKALEYETQPVTGDNG